MKAAVFSPKTLRAGHFLDIKTVDSPTMSPGFLLLRVVCGVCRTDLHIVEGDLPYPSEPRIPGHQIVGEILEGATPELPLGTHVGVSWMGGVDGDCWYCRHGKEKLCDRPTFTGYTVDGGYAQFVRVRSDFAFPLPSEMDGVQAAPLLCAGIIGFRSLRVAGVQPGERIGLFGFGNSAALVMPILKSWGCEAYVVTRGSGHRDEADACGATWVGDENARPGVALDRAITFAPSGKVVVAALSCLRKGGVVAINAVHLDTMPAFDYDTLLWGERQIRSVANMTRKDAKDFLELALELSIKPQTTVMPLDQANQALRGVKEERVLGSVVLIP